MTLSSSALARATRQTRTFVAVLTALLSLTLVAVSAQPASAAVECVTPSAGLPPISLVKEMPAEQLYATPIPVTLRASQPAGPPAESGFNLTFRDVLPANVSYVAGSSNPAPTIINDQPQVGMTTLIWSNVADLAPGADYELTYEVEYDETIFDAGDSVQTGTALPAPAAGAYVNCNPRWIPLFNGAGQPIGTPANSASSSATAAPQQTLLKAIEIEKEEPSPESELLRGIHKNQTPYTLTVRNNTQRPTDNLRVVDYLPAGLEFLSCGTVDNTTNVAYNGGSAQEYPGSGPINPGNAPSFPEPCVTPDSVEFGNFDPDGSGPAPSGLYTRVEWNLASTLLANGEFKMSYAAAIPICPNTTSWTATAPTPASLGQAANLNNNNCSGGETTDETALTNYANAFGDYNRLAGGTVAVSDTDDHTVSAEDLAIWKDSDDDEYAVGETVRWNLHVRTSEYRNFTNVVITDKVPNGMCPVVGNPPPPSPSADAECAPTGDNADNPSLPWNTAVEALAGPDDGTWELTWNLGAMPADQDSTVSFSTLARIYYQSGGADAARVLATDPLTNEVDLKGDGWPICTNDAGDPWPCDTPADQLFHTQAPGTEIIDESEATVNSGLPVLDKQVASPASIGSPAVCPVFNSPGYSNGPAGIFRTGDIVCWKLRVDFPGTVSTGGVTITDFLPQGAEYVSGIPGTGPTSNNDVVIGSVTDNGSFVDFALSAPDVDETGRVFEYIIATRMLNTVEDPDVELPPIRGNLLKMTSVNTAGHVTTYRDQVNAVMASPSLAVTKGVKSINGLPAGGNPANTDGGTVIGGQPVVYRVDVSNSSQVNAVNSRVVERMVGPYDCTMVSAISHGGSCVTTGSGVTALTEITWTGIGVTAGGSTELNFTMTYPNTIAPGVQINDIACVKDFQNETNDQVNPVYTWVVDNPVATCGALSPVPPTNGQLLEDTTVNDPSHVTAPGGVAKTVTTSVDETNNNLASQATIGETITYTVTATIPDQTTIRNFQIADSITNPSRQVYVAGSASCTSTIPGFCLAAMVQHGIPADTVILQAGTGFVTHTNTSGSAQTITLTFDVRVADVGGNSHNGTLTNQATVYYQDQYGQNQAAQTNETTVRIVEPNPQISKTNDDANDVVSPGQEIQYTLTVTNPNRASGPASSPLHNSSVVDLVPTHITPTDGAGTPLTNGDPVTLCDGSAPAASGTYYDTPLPRRIEWSLGTVAPSSSTQLQYCVEVNQVPAPPASVPLTNEATITGTSMPGVVPGERTYSDDAEDTVIVDGSQLTKTANKVTATIGESIDYTISVTLPAYTDFYTYRVLDTLPTGLSYSSTVSTSCTPVPNCASISATAGGSGQNRTWSYGNITAEPVARTLTIVYRAVVQDVVGNVDGVTRTNSATNQWCLVNDDPCDVDDLITPPGDSADVDLVEPLLDIDKDVNCQTGDTDACDIQPGDSFTYTIRVTNNGTSTAYDAVFQDQVPSTLTNVVVGTLPVGVTAATPDAPNTHAWTIASLAPGAYAEITYTADLVASSNLSDPFSVINTARVTEYWGLDDADRASNPEAREYPGTEPTDTVTLNGHMPDPQVVKTVANSGNAEINQCLTWTLTISNNDVVAALNDIDVSDTLPAGWVYCAGSTTLNAVPHADPSILLQTLSWTNVGDIAGNGVTAGANIVLSFGARPTMAALSGSPLNPTNPYTNSATITGEDASGSTESDDGPYTDTDTENANIQMPNLAISKTPDPTVGPPPDFEVQNPIVDAGGWSNWTITVTNTGPGTARDVEIRDLVPAGLFFNVVTNPQTITCATIVPVAPIACDNPSGPLNNLGMPVNSGGGGLGTVEAFWELDSLPANSSVTITIPMRTPADAADGTVWTNLAGVKSTERPTEITDTGVWESERSTDLAITKTGVPNPGTAGTNITYTLLVTNNGPSIGTGVKVTDLIDTSQFEFVSITPADTVNDSCTTDDDGGSPAVINEIECTVGDTMNAAPATNSTASFTLVLKVKSGVTGSVSNTASVDGNEDDPVPSNNQDEEIIPLGTSADVGIVKSLTTNSPGSIPNHGQTSFDLVVTNHGPSDAEDVDVTDTLPGGLSCVSTSPTTGVTGCAGTAGETVTWNIGDLEAGDSVTLTMVVRGEEVGDDWLNEAEVDSSTPDGNPNNNEDSESVDVTPMADLSIDKDGYEDVDSGQNFEYNLRVVNHGPDDAVAPTVVDTLPAGLTFVSYSSTEGGATCVVTGSPATGQTVTCTLPDLDPSMQPPWFDIEIVVNAGFDLSETCVENVASVSSTTFDADTDNNSDSYSTCVGPNADVAIVKSGPAFGADGWPLTYVLSVVNNGPATSENVDVRDFLPAGVSFTSASSTVGSCSYDSVHEEVNCSLGDMAPGATAQITIVVVPGPQHVGTVLHNEARVTPGTPDGNPNNNVDDEDTPIENNQYPTSSNLSLTKTVSNANPRVGDLISYSMVVTNHGPSAAQAATLTDTLPGGLIYSSVSGDGTCSFTRPQLSCQLGDIPAGATRTVVVSAYVAQTGPIVNSAVAGAANDRDPSDNTAISPITSARSNARLTITKKASKKTVKVGGKATFTIKVKNTSRVNAVNVRVCDVIPARMSVVRRAGGQLRSGNLCWDIPVLRAGQSRTFKPVFRISNGRGSKVTNPVRAKGGNTNTARAKATVRVPKKKARAGGTTG